ncbi:uncharacterized protein ARMOST_19785 [Armillaria ostoyae]|uniref:Uncharacterized protein n=1 Tax=Armillaria ostoyae TaxID=47428 RepID=A0A284S5H8_ARMOS|nr:uncharacterized protein ARMOST_19785 [Armillaria ostoyae]
MASSSPPTDDSDPNCQPPSPPTTFSLTPAPSNSYTSRSRRHQLGAPPPQCNATPGPSGTRQTPTPPPSSPELEVNDRDLRARYEQFPPPPMTPLTYHPQNGPYYPSNPALSWASPLFPPGGYSYDLPAGMIPGQRTTAPMTISDDEDLNTLEPSHSEPDLPESISSASRTPSPPPRPLAFTYHGKYDPLNIDGPDFEWNELSAVDILILRPHRTAAWELRRQDVEERYQLSREGRTPMGWYLAVERGDPIPALGRDVTIAARIFHNRNRDDYGPAPGSGWSSPYLSWPLDNERRMLPDSNQFDTFNEDEETFGGYTTEVYGDYQGSTLAPSYPFPFPDAPPRTIQQHGQYHGPKTSRLYAGANEGAEGSNTNPPTDPPQPSNEERLLQARELLAIKDR